MRNEYFAFGCASSAVRFARDEARAEVRPRREERVARYRTLVRFGKWRARGRRSGVRAVGRERRRAGRRGARSALRRDSLGSIAEKETRGRQDGNRLVPAPLGSLHRARRVRVQAIPILIDAPATAFALDPLANDSTVDEPSLVRMPLSRSRLLSVRSRTRPAESALGRALDGFRRRLARAEVESAVAVTAAQPRSRQREPRASRSVPLRTPRGACRLRSAELRTCMTSADRRFRVPNPRCGA